MSDNHELLEAICRIMDSCPPKRLPELVDAVVDAVVDACNARLESLDEDEEDDDD